MTVLYFDTLQGATNPFSHLKVVETTPCVQIQILRNLLEKFRVKKWPTVPSSSDSSSDDSS